MVLIVGLGNLGERFINTRHNAGFLVIDFFAKKNNFPEFELSKKYNSFIAEKDKVLLVKPQTLMNNSGLAVKKIVAQNKKADLLVIHDDIDLPLGTFKIVKNRGSAGHKGVESMIKAVGNKNLVRFRIGVQPSKGKPKKPENFVIKNFTAEEKKTLDTTIKKVSDALTLFLGEGVEKAMNKYN